VLGRLGGDEFVALLADSDCVKTSSIMRRIEEALAVRNRDAQRRYRIRYSVGRVKYDVERHSSIALLLSEADQAMYVDKRASAKFSEGPVN
jgi:diguanylate cyclase (GGDEF)-like protein